MEGKRSAVSDGSMRADVWGFCRCVLRNPCMCPSGVLLTGMANGLVRAELAGLWQDVDDANGATLVYFVLHGTHHNNRRLSKWNVCETPSLACH